MWSSNTPYLFRMFVFIFPCMMIYREKKAPPFLPNNTEARDKTRKESILWWNIPVLPSFGHTTPCSRPSVVSISASTSIRIARRPVVRERVGPEGPFSIRGTVVWPVRPLSVRRCAVANVGPGRPSPQCTCASHRACSTDNRTTCFHLLTMINFFSSVEDNSTC